MKYTYFIMIIACSFLILSCKIDDTVTSSAPVPFKGPTIILWHNGGFAGTVDTILFIDSLGYAENRMGYPPIGYQLTEAEYRSIISMFAKFDTFANYYRGHGIYDGYYDHLNYIDKAMQKEVTIDAELFDRDSLSSALIRLKDIGTYLGRLSQSIYDRYKPWKDVTIHFSTDTTSYLLNSPIRINIVLANPSSSVRKVMFLYQTQFFFDAYTTTPPYVYYYYPRNQLWEGPPSEITIQPNSQYTISYTWNYAADSTSVIIPGIYKLSAGLLLGRYVPELRTSETQTFEIKAP